MKTQNLYCALALCILIISPKVLQATPKYEFALFLPDDTPFWSRVALFSSAASEDLNINLTVFDADANRVLMLKQISDATNTPSRFDLLIFPNFLETASVALPLCEKMTVPCILFNSALNAQESQRFGAPGQHYRHWLAQLIPDDQGSAKAIAESLFTEARYLTPNTKILVAVNGYRSDSPAIKRERGLKGGSIGLSGCGAKTSVLHRLESGGCLYAH